MLQTCSTIAQFLVDQLIDDDIGFSDFLHGEKDIVVTAIQKHWNYLIEKDPRFKDPTESNQLYLALIRLYQARSSKPVNEFVYRAYIRLLVEGELKKLPLFQRQAA